MISDQVVAFVTSRESTPIDVVLAEFGRLISESAARRAVDRRRRQKVKQGYKGKHHGALKDPGYVGRRCILSTLMAALARRGLIRRVSTGVYGPAT